jgi:hypothetical protein
MSDRDRQIRKLLAQAAVIAEQLEEEPDEADGMFEQAKADLEKALALGSDEAKTQMMSLSDEYARIKEQADQQGEKPEELTPQPRPRGRLLMRRELAPIHSLIRKNQSASASVPNLLRTYIQLSKLIQQINAAYPCGRIVDRDYSRAFSEYSKLYEKKLGTRPSEIYNKPYLLGELQAIHKKRHVGTVTDTFHGVFLFALGSCDTFRLLKPWIIDKLESKGDFRQWVADQQSDGRKLEAGRGA